MSALSTVCGPNLGTQGPTCQVGHRSQVARECQPETEIPLHTKPNLVLISITSCNRPLSLVALGACKCVGTIRDACYMAMCIACVPCSLFLLFASCAKVAHIKDSHSLEIAGTEVSHMIPCDSKACLSSLSACSLAPLFDFQCLEVF